MKRTTLVRRSRAADLAKLTGGLSLPVLLLAALGSKVGFVPDEVLLPALALGFILGLSALALGVFALTDIWQSGADGAHAAMAGIVYASPVLALLGLIAAAAFFYPRLTDVTTDPADPPAFRISLPAPRIDVETAALQRNGYPDLRPHTYPVPVAAVYVAARELIADRGWTLIGESHPGSLPEPEPVAAPSEESEEVTQALALKTVVTQSRGDAPAAGAGEQDAGAASGPLARRAAFQEASLTAIAPTPIFGFSDDLAVRVRATGDGTQVDVRSASRIGEHDLGQNARRIKAFLADLDFALQPRPEAPEASVSAAPSDAEPDDDAPPAE